VYFLLDSHMKRNDSLWKGILEDIFDDFLRYFIEDADDIFDFSKQFEFLDKELDQLFPETEGNPKFVDKLVKVFTKEGCEEWILVHIEVQGYQDKEFAERMFTYYYRIWDKYHKPITAFAILSDSNTNYHPNYHERSFLGTRLSYQFNTYKIIDQIDSELEISDNPFAMVILTAKTAILNSKINDEKLFDLKINLVRNLFAKGIDSNKTRALMNFLKLYVRFSKKETDTQFETELEIITNNKKTMGIEELILHQVKEEGKLAGKLEGKLEGADEKVTFIATNLILAYDWDDKKIAALTGVKPEYIASIRKKILQNKN
jgi:predicted transposase/invertase (TIGR01784 family)